MKLMFEETPFKTEHLLELSKQRGGENEHTKAWLLNGKAQLWEESGKAATGLVLGRVASCWGFNEFRHSKCGHIWVVFGDLAKEYALTAFRGMVQSLHATQYDRVEMDVPLDVWFSETGCRRAEMFGFKLECERAVKYRPNGGDSALYAWIRGA